jgi:hypothetical protein
MSTSNYQATSEPQPQVLSHHPLVGLIERIAEHGGLDERQQAALEEAVSASHPGVAGEAQVRGQKGPYDVPPSGRSRAHFLMHPTN